MKFTKYGNTITFDDEDLELYLSRDWRVLKIRDLRYLIEYKDHLGTLFHRLVVNAKESEVVDHIDGNGLNNSRSNLRICNQGENSRNRKIHKNNKSGYKGVTLDKRNGRYAAKIVFQKKKYLLGSYLTPEEAHEKYKEAARKLHGQFANFG